MTPVTRNRLAKGDEVYVIQHIADGVPPKRIRARVISIVRKAAKVRFLEDSKTGQRGERTVRFSNLEFVEDPNKLNAASKALVNKVPHVVVHQSHVVEIPPLPPRKSARLMTPPESKASAPAPVGDDLDEAVNAWLDMGRDLIEPLAEELRTLSEEEQVLHEEIAAAERELDELATRKGAVQSKLNRLRSVIQATTKITP